VQTTQDFVDQCLWVYKELVSEAVPTDDNVLVWEGAITKWMTKKQISTDKYSKIFQALKAMGCVETLTAGNRYTSTILGLNGEPTLQKYVQAKADGSFEKSLHKTRILREKQKHDQLLERITILETKVEALIEGAKNGTEAS
jgi:bacterioferritin (cytochrome b1)